MSATPGRVWVRAAEVSPPSVRDRLLLFLFVVVAVTALQGRSRFEPRLGGGTLVEVAGAVERPGFHLLGSADVASALEAAGGRATSDARLLAPGDRVFVGPDSLSVGLTEDPLLLARRVDVNRATPASLETLPGVGPSLAAAIAEHRDGGRLFYEVGDLGEVRGMGAAKVESLRPLVTVGDVGPRPVPPPFRLETATVAEFERLPGIGPVLAARIVADRQARGPFGSVEDLDRVHGVGPSTIARVRAALESR